MDTDKKTIKRANWTFEIWTMQQYEKAIYTFTIQQVFNIRVYISNAEQINLGTELKRAKKKNQAYIDKIHKNLKCKNLNARTLNED